MDGILKLMNKAIDDLDPQLKDISRKVNNKFSRDILHLLSSTSLASSLTIDDR